MASLSRLHNICAIRRIFSPPTKLNSVTVRRWISKSEGKQDASATVPKSSPSISNPVPKNWVSWGFSRNNYFDDRFYVHVFFFFGISWALILSSWIIFYYPDLMKNEWAHREAFLELRRREAAGLPLVDPDYIPASQMKLPSEEQLGSYEIII
ncbi:hypothetical protein FOCC_FOCC008591 [Frankliniella occidentalis]|uniref:NADH dehydrogenase [ubiquinone] 1 beta subcomplex subunit 11, mitochondrial n=1 Tax=Frankliniella occidentalis TaxID=133901 RepID=A0A6J1SYR8_FRAOC|nr:NADH dehydrogenase [ubiquinone] 1 beta subcomplex subunit 11, mitochondrial [Frankliniella occidentalis]KAE8744775.1 hypothetical protein FOCC_FOCC008591 [Frankliniella occidentalis]